jgi:hypothetical protein
MQTDRKSRTRSSSFRDRRSFYLYDLLHSYADGRALFLYRLRRLGGSSPGKLSRKVGRIEP